MLLTILAASFIVPPRWKALSGDRYIVLAKSTAYPAIVRLDGALEKNGDRLILGTGMPVFPLWTAPMTVLDCSKVELRGSKLTGTLISPHGIIGRLTNDRPVPSRLYLALIEPQVNGGLRYPYIAAPWITDFTLRATSLNEVTVPFMTLTYRTTLPRADDRLTQLFLGMSEAFEGLSTVDTIWNRYLVTDESHLQMSAANNAKVNQALKAVFPKCNLATQLQIAFVLEDRGSSAPGTDSLELAIRCLDRMDIGFDGKSQDGKPEMLSMTGYLRQADIERRGLSAEDLWNYGFQAKSPALAALFFESGKKLPSRATVQRLIPKMKTYWLCTQVELLEFFALEFEDPKLKPKFEMNPETDKYEWVNRNEVYAKLEAWVQNLP
jgi:hypothetical protein